MVEQEIKIGRYRHFKGNEYEVLGIAKHSETTEEMVVYRALYGEHELFQLFGELCSGGRTCWTRQKDGIIMYSVSRL